MLFVVYTIMVSVSWGSWTICREVDGLKAEISEMSRDVGARLDEQSALMQQQSVQLDQLLLLAQQRGR